MNTGKVLIGILAGVAAGALLGVLFAPQRGAVTRRKICREGENLSNDLKEKFEEILDTVTEKFNKVKKDVTDFTEKNMKVAEEVEKDLKTAKH